MIKTILTRKITTSSSPTADMATLFTTIAAELDYYRLINLKVGTQNANSLHVGDSFY